MNQSDSDNTKLLSKPFDIFLSYKSEDFAWVSQLKTDLQKRGVKVWLDRTDIRPGDLFAAALEDGLESSQAVGLVVTPESLASGWVKEEYYRALSLSKETGLQLIPLILRDAQLPGFLSGRHHVDFRDNATYEQKVDRIVWPGITGRQVLWIGVNNRYWWPWPRLGSILERRGLDTSGSTYVHAAMVEVDRVLDSGHRAVVVADVFENWPQSGDITRPSEYVDIIFNIRKWTKGTRNEVVFVLYQDPDGFDSGSHSLDPKTVERLRHYFLIPRLFDDSLDGSKGVAPQAIHDLESKFAEVWLKVQRELLRSERPV